MELTLANQIIEVATDICRTVGARIRQEIFAPSGIRVSQKKADELVTELDLWSEEQITLSVAKHFPSHLLLGEETYEKLVSEHKQDFVQLASHGICWVVDPIDGTTNFVKGIPQVSISIGVLENGRREVGLVYDTVRDELFTAIRGQGAKLNGNPIKVSTVPTMKEAVLATGFPYDHVAKWGFYKPAYESLFLEFRDIRRFGSAALDACWVACGRFDAFFEYTLRAWDVAAGALIVEEAGGCCGNLAGDEFSIHAESFLFAPPALFSPALKIARAAHERACKV